MDIFEKCQDKTIKVKRVKPHTVISCNMFLMLYSLAQIKNMECFTIDKNDIWTRLKPYWLEKSYSDWKKKIQVM